MRAVGRARRNVGGGVLALAVLVVTLAPGLAAKIAARRAATRLGTRVDVGWLRWNPLTGWWVLEHLRVAADHGPAAIRARRIAARVGTWDLVRGKPRLRGLELRAARIRLRAGAGGWELPLPAVPAAEAEP